MRIEEFDFHLPEEQIALRPVSPRHSARMLMIDARDANHAQFQDRVVWDLPDMLTPKDMVIVNNTKVIPSYLFAMRKGSRGSLNTEINLHKQIDGKRWLAFAKKTKRLYVGDKLNFLDISLQGHGNTENVNFPTNGETLSATIMEKHDGGEILLQFDAEANDIHRKLQKIGHMPIPPYIAKKRAVDVEDLEDYQTMFASHIGAVAAPTASLHFTEELLHKLAHRGISKAEVTLHVGAGTFMPVKVPDTKDHKMHAEWGDVSEEVVDKIVDTKSRGGRIVAVGTTVLRILESAAQNGSFKSFRGDTSIFITPGYNFKVVDVLMTNFHLPRSTLFMLVSAFCGLETMKCAYEHAILHKYRFYSYGDSCLLFR